MKMCPRKFNENTVDVAGIHGGCECEEGDCAKWHEQRQECGDVVNTALLEKAVSCLDEIALRLGDIQTRVGWIAAEDA